MRLLDLLKRAKYNDYVLDVIVKQSNETIRRFKATEPKEMLKKLEDVYKNPKKLIVTKWKLTNEDDFDTTEIMIFCSYRGSK